MSMTIRPLKKSDYQAFREMLKQYKVSVGEPAFTEDQFQTLIKAIEGNYIEFYVVEKEEKLIAMCSIARFFSTFNFTNSAIFEDFYVEKTYRGKGIARQLIEYVFKSCSESGVDSVLVGSSEVDADMYRSLGFSNALGKLLAKIISE